MKAAVYFGPRDVRCVEVGEPAINAGHEVLVAVKATSICGSDLHIYSGALDPIMRRGHSRTGHELVGEVLETGTDVRQFKVGDRISMAYSCSCGACFMCRAGQTAHCETTAKSVYGFGDLFGDLNGAHAQRMVLPYAEAHAMVVPEPVGDAAAVSLSCNLPTAMIANQLADVRRGETVAVLGCGPTGMMALHLLMHSSPSVVVAIDYVAERRQRAECKGALGVDAGEKEFMAAALTHTEGRGFDKVIEMVGTPESLSSALALVRAGGTVAALGVFTEVAFNVNPADLFLRDITVHMHGFANVQPCMAAGLRLIQEQRIDPAEFFTQEFSLDEIDGAFSVFAARADGAGKVLIRP